MAVNLLDVSSEILLHILQFVDATDLYHLSFVCQRLHNLVRDEYLWVWCEGRTRPNSQQKIEFCESNVNDRTRVMLLAGEYHCETVISNDFLERAGKLKSLTVLALENQYLNGTEVPLVKYPPLLEELSLRNSYVTNYKEYFKQCASILTNLRVLCLDQCNWFDSHFLLAISKLKALEILSLYLCKQLSDFDLSYISLAGVHGFKSLKILDIRFTGYGDEVLKSFCNNKSIREIYFQGYAKSYQLDCAMRKLDILHGSPTVFHNYLDPFFQVDDTNPVAMIKTFGDSFTLTSQNMQKVTDRGVRNYAFLHINMTEEYVPPKSILYKSPYGECTCGYMRPEPENTNSCRIPPSFVAESQRLELEKQINVLMNRKGVPDVYFLEVNRSALHSDGEEPADWGWLGNREPQTDMEIFIMQHMSPMLYQHIMSISGSTEAPISNVIEVDLSRNTVRLLPRRTMQRSLVRVARVFVNQNFPNPLPFLERNNVENGSAPERAQPADTNDEPSTSQRGTKRKHEESKEESKHPKLDEPCCSKSLTEEEKLPEVQEDNLCFKDKMKSGNNGQVVEASSSEDEEIANNVALGNEEEACSNAEPAAVLANKEVAQNDPPVVNVREIPPALVIREVPPPPLMNVPMDVFIEHNHLMRRAVQKWGETGVRCLSLRGYDRVTDTSLQHLQYLRLDLLDVTLTSVTSAGVEHFKSTNPHCRLIHETACRCRPRLHF